MGTPDFAVAPLRALLEAGHEIAAVVTQPDKQKGRGKEVQMTPVKVCALEHHIPVLQPVKIRKPEVVAQLEGYGADVFIVAAFGQILSEEILHMPPLGCINIHASLLPAYRGAAPIQWAILNGEQQTGVTIMQMDKGVDTGGMFCHKAVPISSKETGESLHDKLMEAGAKLIVEALPKIESGALKPIPQEEALASHAGKLTKDMGRIDFRWEAEKIERWVRGLNSWPSAYTEYKGKTLKIWDAEVQRMEAREDAAGKQKGNETILEQSPGTVLQVGRDFIDAACGRDVLRIREVQLEGKKRMPVKEFLLGNGLEPGERLGNSN